VETVLSTNGSPMRFWPKMISGGWNDQSSAAGGRLRQFMLRGAPGEIGLTHISPGKLNSDSYSHWTA